MTIKVKASIWGTPSGLRQYVRFREGGENVHLWLTEHFIAVKGIRHYVTAP